MSFFLVEAQAWRIDDSIPAPVFEVIARPNDWARAQKQASSEAKNAFEPEIQAFYERLREHGMSTAKNIKQWGTAPARRWYNVNVGSPLAHIVFRVTKNARRVNVELYIRNSKELFASLEAEKAAIEAEMGMPLQWLELPEQKSSRIVAVHEGSFDDESVSDDPVTWMIETADRFAITFGRYL